MNAQWWQYFLTYVRDGTDPYKNFSADLHLDEAQYGLLSGTFFTFPNSFAAIIMGYQVDKFNRKYLLLTCIILWNLICLIMFFSNAYYQLILTRIGFALISSVHNPACISLINDYFQHEQRARANALYVTAISFGVGFANLTSFMNEQVGWRNCVLITSGFGFLVGLLVTCLKEPLR